jgi:IS1 family transposase/transposase-like protein
METLTAQFTCEKCGVSCKRFGKHRNGLQRFRCRVCGATYTEEHESAFRVEDYLNDDRGIMALKLLVEGCSVRTVERLSGIRRDTIIDILKIAGERCEAVLESLIQNVPVKDVEADECWSFIGMKEKNKRDENAYNDELGDCYCWVAIERNSKLVLAYVVGRRTLANAFELMRKLRRATSENRFQLTTDGLKAYEAAVDEMISDRVDFAQLIKIYASPREGEQRYSPAEVVEAVPVIVSGNPDKKRICTSIVERQNLTMRTSIRRMTRLTNGFSKKLESHKAAIALHFAYYNFCKIHGSLRVTPAMEAGIADHIWTISELVA